MIYKINKVYKMNKVKEVLNYFKNIKMIQLLIILIYKRIIILIKKLVNHLQNYITNMKIIL